jgi:hypothetical protein
VPLLGNRQQSDALAQVQPVTFLVFSPTLAKASSIHRDPSLGDRS